MFCKVALRAARNRIFDYVALVTIYAINSIIGVCTVKFSEIISLFDSGGWSATVKTVAASQAFELFPRQSELNTVTSCPVAVLSVKHVEHRFTNRLRLSSAGSSGDFNLNTATTLSTSPGGNCFASAVTLESESSAFSVRPNRRVRLLWNLLHKCKTANPVSRLYVSGDHAGVLHYCT